MAKLCHWEWFKNLFILFGNVFFLRNMQVQLDFRKLCKSLFFSDELSRYTTIHQNAVHHFSNTYFTFYFEWATNSKWLITDSFLIQASLPCACKKYTPPYLNHKSQWIQWRNCPKNFRWRHHSALTHIHRQVRWEIWWNLQGICWSC